jgi:hypothetical protein
MSHAPNENELFFPPELMAEIRDEADSIVREYDVVPVGMLADALERSLVANDGGLAKILGVIFELRRRSSAGIRTWSTPRLIASQEVA